MNIIILMSPHKTTLFPKYHSQYVVYFDLEHLFSRPLQMRKINDLKYLFTPIYNAFHFLYNSSCMNIFSRSVNYSTAQLNI